MRPLALFTALVWVGGCATLGATTGGDVGLPSANMGPFRPLEKTEDLGYAPFVFDGAGVPYREPAVLAADPSDPTSMSVYLYMVASVTTGTTTADIIVRTLANDGRSFYGTSLDDTNGPTKPETVLTASLPWEGSDVGGPSVLYVGSKVYLYYAAAGGIGVATSTDGVHFTKADAPVLPPDAAASWETTTPAAPSVAVLPGGTFDMMYAAGTSIGEATSADGVHFTRALGNPVLSPSPKPLGSIGTVAVDGGDASADAPSSGPFDTGQVSDPCIVPVVTPAGRLDVRVLYTGWVGPPSAASRSSAIGLAARYGTTGPLVRQPDSVFSIPMNEVAAPAYFAWSSGEMVYGHANVGGGFGATPYAAVAAGFAPAQATLPVPSGYPASL
jgi:hypothetical protein